MWKKAPQNDGLHRIDASGRTDYRAAVLLCHDPVSQELWCRTGTVHCRCPLHYFKIG
jgi:hypothetical protein